MAKRTAIGLDIGTSGVRAAELSFTRTGVVLERFGQIAVPEGAVDDGQVVRPDEVRDAIIELWTATKFSSKRVALGVANQRVAVRTIELPRMSRGDLRKTLGFQVADMIPFPVDQAILDFHPIEDVVDGTTDKVRGMLVAATRDSVMANVACVQAAGLQPVSVDLTPFAVLRSVGRQFDPMIDTEAIVDIGARVTNVIVHSAGQPRFVRILLMGGEDITDTLGERMGLARDHAEHIKQRVGLVAGRGEDVATARVIEEAALRLVDEIRGSLDYYAASNQDAPLDCVTISGGASCMPGLIDQIAAATRVPTRRADPMATLEIGQTGLDEDQLAMVQPLSAVPVGLALGVA